MISLSLPDLAAARRFERDAGAVRAELDRAGRELATGRKEDLAAAANGDPGRLLAIESERSRVDQLAQAASLGRSRAAATQSALAALESHADAVGVPLEAALGRDDAVTVRLLGREADAAFRAAAGTLNHVFAGRALFAGAATDGAAFADPDAVLAGLRSVIAGSAAAASAVAAVDAWIDAPGGGYETTAFTGDATDAPGVGLGEGRVVKVSVRADDPVVRDLVYGLAVAAIASEPGYAGPPGSSELLLEAASARALKARAGFVDARAEVGMAEQAIENAATAASARRSALDIAWNDSTTRDPYEAAAEFASLEQQLNATFAVNARISRLSLLDFIK